MYGAAYTDPIGQIHNDVCNMPSVAMLEQSRAVTTSTTSIIIAGDEAEIPKQ